MYQTNGHTTQTHILVNPCNNATVKSHCGDHQSASFRRTTVRRIKPAGMCRRNAREIIRRITREGEVTNHWRRLLMLRDNAGRHGNGHAPAMNVCDCSISTASSVDELRDLPSVCAAARRSMPAPPESKPETAGVTSTFSIRPGDGTGRRPRFATSA